MTCNDSNGHKKSPTGEGRADKKENPAD